LICPALLRSFMSEKRSYLVLLAIVVVTVGCFFVITRLKFSYDFEAFFPKKDPETSFYYHFREQFETDNDFYIVALEEDQSIFRKDFLGRVDSLTNDLRSLKYVVEAVGPTQLSEYYRDPAMGQIFQIPLLRWEEPEYYAVDSTRIYQSPTYVGLLFSPDAQSVAINIKQQEKLSKAKCDSLSYAVEAAVAKYHFRSSHIIGRGLGQRVYVKMMVEELALFISLSLILTIVFLFIAFRSGWGVMIPVMVVLISITWTLGFIGILGRDLDLMLTVLPTIIFVVGMSDSVHVLTKYMQELRNGKEKREAIRYAFKSIRLATFLTAVTTSIGFLTLMFSNIQPISDFGLYTAVGVMLAYGLTYTMLPAVLLLAKPKRLYVFASSDDFWTKRLHRSFRFILRNRKTVFWGFLGVLAISMVGIFSIKVDNVMLEDLRDSHRLKKEFNFMEKKFSGCRPFELAIKLDSTADVFSPQVLQDLDTIDQYLKKEYKVGSLFSLTSMIRMSNQSFNAGQQEYFRIPDNGSDIRSISKFLNRKDMDRFTHLCYDEKTKTLRVSGKVADLGRQHYDSLNANLRSFIAGSVKTPMETHVTGTAHLIDLNNRYLVENMLWDLLLSVVVIGLVMGAVYKSWKMVILTIIPNLVPLILVGGIMGAVGIPLKISTSIIFNIAFGIAVDDTIHFLARVRTLLGEGMSVNYAVKRTFLSTGKAMVVTTLILSGGFLTLVLSDFLGTFYIGFLISLTLFVALIAELLITPLVVMFFYRK
jgi:uncharacterized protein